MGAYLNNSQSVGNELLIIQLVSRKSFNGVYISPVDYNPPVIISNGNHLQSFTCNPAVESVVVYFFLMVVDPFSYKTPVQLLRQPIQYALNSSKNTDCCQLRSQILEKKADLLALEKHKNLQ